MPHDLIRTCLSIQILQLIEGRNLAEEQPSIKPAISLWGGLALTTLVNRNKLDLQVLATGNIERTRQQWDSKVWKAQGEGLMRAQEQAEVIRQQELWVGYSYVVDKNREKWEESQKKVRQVRTNTKIRLYMSQINHIALEKKKSKNSSSRGSQSCLWSSSSDRKAWSECGLWICQLRDR